MTQPKAINVPRRSDIPGRATPGPSHGFSRITKHESRNTAFFRPGLRSMKIMVREMSLIRGLGAPAKEMSFRHHLALFKDHSCPLLPTIARHCPRLPAKKMLQARVASQYGRRSRGPGRVPRAAPRQPGCTVEQTNHEPGSFLPRGASRREFRGLHESRVTKHESRLFAVGAPGRRHRKPPSGPLRPPASHCFPVHRCSPLFAIVQMKILFGADLHVSPRGEAKWVRGPSGQGASRAEEKGASRLARAGVLEQYVEHGKQAQRSPGARIRVLRPSGGETCRLVSSRRPVTAFLRAVGRLSRGMRGGPWGVRQCPCPGSRSRSALRRASPAGQTCREHKMNPC